MVGKKLSQTLYVFMNGTRVGVLTRKVTGELQFQYDELWLQHPARRPISLSMSPLTEVPFTGEKVENFFDNLLPDNENIRRRIRARFQARSTQCFDLLSEIGADCVGALQLLKQPNVLQQKKIKAHPINDAEIASLLKHYQSAPLGMQPGTDFRISIAGAQEKTALLWHKNQWNIPLGTTPTSHIIKLPIGYIQHSGMDLSDSVENEWLCLQILDAYELPVNMAKITVFHHMKVLVVERFDRRWTQNGKNLIRLPQEDMCQALGIFSDLKYESEGGPGITQIMGILNGAYDAKADRQRFMKSTFLFWVLGAIDGHAKNFSIFIDAQGRYRLTPLYDVISAYPLIERHQLQKQKIKMAMSVKSKNRHYHWLDILPRHWLAMAAHCQFSTSEMQIIIDEAFDEMENVISHVNTLIPNDFPMLVADSIFDNMRKLKNRFFKL